MNKSHHNNGINQKYFKEKKKWMRLTILATGIPVFLSIVVGLFTSNSIIRLVGNGDIILSLFALLLSMHFNVFEEKKGDDDQLSNANLLCFLIMVFQLTWYISIKMVNNNLTVKVYPHMWFIWNIKKEDDFFKLSSLVTLILFFATIETCIYSIKAIYYHKEKRRKQLNTDNASSTKKKRVNNSTQ